MSSWEYDLGGAVCTCPSTWNRADYLYKVFLDPDMSIMTVAHFLDPMKVYIFTQNAFFAILVSYWDESLEEIALMFTNKWGWFGNNDYRAVEPRYISLISDPVLSAPLSVLQGYALMSIYDVSPLFSFGNIIQKSNIILIIEHFALGGLWVLSHNPDRKSKMFDFGNWKLLLLSVIYPTALWIVYWINSRLGLYASNRDEWFQIHTWWSIVTAFVTFFCYVNITPSPQLTAMLASAISIIGLFFLGYKLRKTSNSQTATSFNFITHLKISTPSANV